MTLPEYPAENTRPASPAPPLILPFIHRGLFPGDCLRLRHYSPPTARRNFFFSDWRALPASIRSFARRERFRF
jgi:hypothetical protein